MVKWIVPNSDLQPTSSHMDFFFNPKTDEIRIDSIGKKYFLYLK